MSLRTDFWMLVFLIGYLIVRFMSLIEGLYRFGQRVRQKYNKPKEKK